MLNTPSPDWAVRWPSELHRVLKLLKGAPKNLRAIEIWVMVDRQARQSFKREVQERFPGVQVDVLSSYKPLLNFVLDELWENWQVMPPRSVTLHYPVHDVAHPDRFLLETYPLAGLLQQLGVRLRTQAHHVPSHSGYMYELECGDDLYLIPLVQRPFADVYGQSILRPTGHLKFVDRRGQVSLKDFKTDLEECWDTFLKWLRAQPWPDTMPLFGQLRIEATLPYADDPIPFGLEHSSPLEALSEEFYFGVLEFFHRRLKVPDGSRTLQPGQVVPVVRSGEPELRIKVQPLAEAEAPDVCSPLPDLADLDHPLTTAELHALLGKCGIAHTTGQSVQRRDLPGLLFPGEGRGVLITAGQHANETTGVVAALRAINDIKTTLPVAFIPLENPDGYALHEHLCQHAPTHMHHAARYTALGDDLSFRAEPTHEKAVRHELQQAVNAKLHVNLHGYPAHEWTRPLTGYVPRAFAAWTLPRGFLLIVRHQPAYAQGARDLLEHVTRDLAQWPELMALNTRQRHASQAHTTALPDTTMHGTPFTVQERENLPLPLELITEFPDETVYGERFQMGVEAQLRVIRSAIAWAEQWQAD